MKTLMICFKSVGAHLIRLHIFSDLGIEDSKEKR